MPSDWRERLSRLPHLDDPERIWQRVDQGPSGDGVPPAPQRGQRLVAAVVAIAVFGVAAVFAFGALREDPAPADDDSPPPDGGALVGTLDAPDDGSMPSLELRYEGETASIHPQGGEWPGGPDAWTEELQSAPTEVLLGTQIAFVGDVEEVDATIRYGLVGGRPTEPLEAMLPDVPGDYVIEVLGTWPQGTAAFTFSVQVRDPEAVSITWEFGDDVPWVHARYRDRDVELTTIPGEMNMVAIAEEALAELAVPEGTDVWVSGEATSLDATLSSGGETIRFEQVPSPLPAEVLRDLEPGRQTLGVELETAQGGSTSLLTLTVKASGASSEPPPDGAVVTIQRAPLRATLTYDDQRQVALIEDEWKPSGDLYEDARPSCELGALAYAPFLVVPPGTPFVVESDPRLEGWTVFPQPDSDPEHLPTTTGTVEWTFRGGWDDLGFDACFGLFVGAPGTTTPVPDVTGLLDQRAYDDLAEGGLAWEVGLVHAPDEPQWRVVRSEPPAGMRVLPNTTVRIVVATTITPLPAGADDELACEPDDRIQIGGPHTFLLPSGEAFVRANLWGLGDGDDVIDAEGPGSGDDGLWHVVRDGQVIAVVDYGGLDGVACRGSRIAGA